jgi:hypothetical protein
MQLLPVSFTVEEVPCISGWFLNIEKTKILNKMDFEEGAKEK